MPRYAQVFRVFIASPSDVFTLRATVYRAIESYNKSRKLGRSIVEPIGWESDTYPVYTDGETIQDSINTQIVDSSDILIGIFGKRIGTPTKKAVSGTVEEIERAKEQKKSVLIYFLKEADEGNGSDKKDGLEKAALSDYKENCQKNGLVGFYSSDNELHNEIVKHLTLVVTELENKIEEKLKCLAHSYENNISLTNAGVSRFVFDFVIDEEDQGKVEFHCQTFEPSSKKGRIWENHRDIPIFNHRKIDRCIIENELKEKHHCFKFYLKVSKDLIGKYYSKLLYADAIVTGEGSEDTDNGFWRIWFLHREGFVHPLESKVYLVNQAIGELSVFKI
jgi:hypothetical protein